MPIRFKKELSGGFSIQRDNFFAGFNIGGNIGFGGLGRVAGFGGERRIQAPILTPRAPQPQPLPPVIAPPTVPVVGILNDIISNVVGGLTGGAIQDINAQPQSGISNVLNDFILGQTSSRQEREVRGTPRAGDLFKAVTRGGPLPSGFSGIPELFGGPLQGLPTFGQVGGVSQIADLAFANIERGTQGFSGDQSMPLSLVQPGVCPPGAQTFPPGTCLLDFQWEDAGGPRGFEIIGRNVDGRAILKKRGRRRRRRGLTKTQMGQVSWACNLPPNCRKEVLHGIVHG